MKVTDDLTCYDQVLTDAVNHVLHGELERRAAQRHRFAVGHRDGDGEGTVAGYVPRAVVVEADVDTVRDMLNDVLQSGRIDAKVPVRAAELGRRFDLLAADIADEKEKECNSANQLQSSDETHGGRSTVETIRMKLIFWHLNLAAGNRYAVVYHAGKD